MPKTLLGLLLIVVFAVTACAEKNDDPAAQAVIDYFQAKVEGNADALGGLLCAELESTLTAEANSFASVVASLREVECASSPIDNNTARVACTGYIFVDYGQQQSELPLSAYRVVQEDGEWKWCGETE